MQAWGISLAALLLAATGCKAPPVTPNLHAADAESRIAGIVAAAESDDPAELPELVEALGDDDPAIRVFAAEALRRRTGRSFGYRAYDPPKQRAEAVDAWRHHLSIDEADTLSRTTNTIPPATD